MRVVSVGSRRRLFSHPLTTNNHHAFQAIGSGILVSIMLDKEEDNRIFPSYGSPESMKK